VEVWNAWRESNPDVNADLSHANLQGVNLSLANLRFANLYGASFGHAFLRGTNFNGSFLKGAFLWSEVDPENWTRG
ncbi:MAG TPA: pentapeptide repeat-containing protein, partial [Oculatellaceae cyanobacterium]